MKKFSFIGVILVLSGCQTPLDRQQAELIAAWGNANRTFAEAIDAYRGHMDVTMSNHFTYSRERAQRQFQEWLGKQTVGEVLVATDDDDKPIRDDSGNYTLPQAAPIRRTYDSLLATLGKIDEEEVAWEKYSTELDLAIERFKKLNEVNLKSSADIAKAKESVQQFLDSTIAVFAGIAGGLGVGISVAP